MYTVSELLELEVPSFGWINWTTRFDEIAPYFPEWNISTREDDPDCPDYAPGSCTKRSAIITTAGRVCGADAVVHLNFCNESLCAVHYFFDPGEVRSTREFYVLVECLRKRISRELGVPLMRTQVKRQPEVSFRWSEDDLHVELVACEARGRDVALAANDPDICPSCLNRGR